MCDRAMRDRPCRPTQIYSGTHQITSAGLGAVECAVGAVEEVFRRLDAGFREIGDADAHGEAKRLTLSNVERVRLDLVAQPLGKGDRARLTRLRNGNDELIAAISRDRV